MPDIVSDIVDVYVFRRQNARMQFLLLQRKASVPLGNSWQSFHTQIQGHETTISAATRAVRELSGLTVSEAYSADYINEFFDDTRDLVVLAPVLATHVSAQAPVTLGHELKECAWWDTNQAIARLPFSGQRWAVRHISDLMGAGYDESQLYRLHLPADDTNPPRNHLHPAQPDEDRDDFDAKSDDSANRASEVVDHESAASSGNADEASNPDPENAEGWMETEPTGAHRDV